MNCPECHIENPEAANFCYECGHTLPLTTKATSPVISFDEKLAKIQRYLPRGITDKILNQKEKLEGERRQVTVMFCDMEGFTPLVDMLGSEEAYQIMDQVYEILIHSVHDFEGTVNEMTGDGIMALFGAPIALEDAPQRALWSALSIHREIVRLNRPKKAIEPIKMRIGIHTGPVVVGTLGNDLRVEFKAVGNTVNLASRMEKLAEAGSTYVTEETFKQTKELFRFETVGKKSVKGKKESILVYKVLSAKKDVYRPRLGSERRIYSKMVGRDKELDRLELQVMKVINGAGSVVNIIGEAGIGKSRLVAELKKNQVIRRTRLIEGRAISIGRNLNFHPIIDVLKQWARIREDDGEAMALGKLESAVRSLYPEEFADVLPFVATLMGMKLSGKNAERVRGIEGEALEKLILKNLRELIIKATQQTPLVLVFEDLHWADTSSIELMKSIFRLAETHRILFINVFRPGHKETSERVVETVKERLRVYYVEIVLRPLDESKSETLITNMLNIGEIHHALIGEITRRTGGNPFFMEEVVRSLIDQRAIILKNRTFQVTKKLGAVAIPNTVNDVLMARIDRLEDESHKLIKIASVIGRNFFYRILSEVAVTVEDMEGKLSYLKQAEFIRERKRMGEVEFLFKHALTQEAAYESILPRKRKELHLKVANSIEKVFSQRLHEFYGMLAYHYSKAEDLEKTEEYLIKAGEEALKSSASNEALHYYQEALSLYLKMHGEAADPAKIAMLEKNIALALHNRALYAESVEHFNKAINYYWGELPKHPISAAFKLLSGIADVLVGLYLPSLKFKRIPTQRDIEAVDLYFKKNRVLAIIDAKTYFIESFYFLKKVTSFNPTKLQYGIGYFAGASSLFSFSGISFGLSRKILDSTKEKINPEDEKQLVIYDLLETLHYYLEGNWKEIRDHDDDMVKKILSKGDLYFAPQHLLWHGYPKLFQGEFNIAKLIVNKLNEIGEVYENDFSLLLKSKLNTDLLTECRNFHDAMIELEQAIDFTEKTGFGISLLELYSRRAMIQMLMGDIAEAEKSLQQADKVRTQVHAAPVMLSTFYLSQLEYLLYRLEESKSTISKSDSIEYREKAFKSGRMLLKISRKAAQHRTESYKLFGVYYWLIEEQKKALKWWNRSIKEAEYLGARLGLSRTYFEVGKRLLEARSKYKKVNGIEAEEYLERAKVLFEEMELQWDLNELSRIDRGYEFGYLKSA
jgi:predicted ATPase/class 3 adenylate cyclase